MKPRAHRSQDRPALFEERLAKGLGWFSIALGLVEIFAPRDLARFIGVRKTHPLLMLGLGLREIVSGIGILSQRRPAGWLWSRVAGDAMDLSLLGTAYSDRRSEHDRLEAATLASAGVTALDIFAAVQLSRRERDNNPRGQHVARSIAIDRTPEEVYSFWRSFENLPRFMRHLESVHVIDSTRSHWVAKGPAGTRVEWDAEIIAEEPGRMIAWQSLPGAQVPNAGSVHFEAGPQGHGTFVRVKLEYNPPAGKLGAAVARLFGKSPETQVQGDLYRFKQIMETGQVTTTAGQPAGRGSSTSRLYDDLVRN